MRGTWFARSTLLAGILSAGAGAARLARGQDTLQARPDTARLQQIEVTGAREFEYLRNRGTVPVDVVPLAPIKLLGNTELSQILNFAAPAFQSVTQTQTDGNDFVDFAQLRGLGADQTLVLINGKRRHTSSLVHLGDNINEGTAGVDLNSIPVSAIERIEILRDGAAAQYGSDAIAGVINIILKSNAAGGAVTGLGGVTSEGDGEQFRVDGNAGVSIGARGYLNVTAEYRHRNPFNRVGRWTGNVYFGNLFNFGEFGPNGEYNSEEEYQGDLDRIAARGFDRDNVQIIGDSRITNAALFVNAAVPLGDSTEAYAFGGLGSRQGTASAFYRFPADQAVSELSLYPDGYLPFITADILDQALTGGVRATRGGWAIDFGNTFGRNQFDFGVDNSLNASLGAESPTVFEAGGTRLSENLTRLEVARHLPWQGGERGVRLDFGAEYRFQRYQIVAGDEASWQNFATGPGDTTANGGRFSSGSQGFPGYQPVNEVDRSRRNVGVFADAEATVARGVVLGAAGRFENYSDFGSRVVGKLAGLARVGGGLSLRGSVNNGFRAPSLPQLHTNKVSTIFVGNAPVQVGLFNNSSTVVRALGVTPLKPETSTSVSGGFTFDGLGRLRLAVDGYIVWVDDRILVSGSLDRGDNPAIDASLAAFPDVQAVQFFSNAADTRTRGLDIVASYPVLLGRGVLTLSGAANFNETRIEGAIRTPAGLGDTELLNPQERSWLETALVPSKIIVTGKLDVDRFTAALRATRFGAVESINIFGPNEEVPAAVLVDVNVGYRVGSVALALGANNLFNKFPPEQDAANSYFGIFRYSRVTPYGIRGRFVYTSVALAL